MWPPCWLGSCTAPAGMNPPDSSYWLLQLFWLLTLAVPIACIAWTVTHEEVFREPRDYFTRRSEASSNYFVRKFFYLLTCEYCFSHYVTIFFLILTRYRLLLDDWRGYLISFFALVAVANVYMSSFGRLRQEVKSEKLDAEKKEKELEAVPSSPPLSPSPGEEGEQQKEARFKPPLSR
jgi:hypothetical protein